MSNPYDFTQSPNIAGAGDYAQMLAGLFRPQQQTQQQKQQQQQNRGVLANMLPRNPDGSVNWAGLLGQQNAATPVNPAQPTVQSWQQQPPGSPWG